LAYRSFPGPGLRPLTPPESTVGPLTRRYFLGLLSLNCLVNDVLANSEAWYGFPDFRLDFVTGGVFSALDRRRGPSMVRVDQQHIFRHANQLHVLVFKRLPPDIQPGSQDAITVHSGR
jgi:hypothetical protein